MEEARQRVADYPTLVKMSAYDGCKNGVRVEEAITIAQMLQDAGCDAIEAGQSHLDVMSFRKQAFVTSGGQQRSKAMHFGSMSCERSQARTFLRLNQS
jgi:2,4-dienoyl-CoA reductase-like NADH-dependent reductase (Old Yellow Enzyme family)